MSKIHAATMNSPRLKKLLRALRKTKWRSTFALMMETKLCAVGTAIQELKVNGYDIKCRCVGRGKFEYRRAG